MGYIFCIMGMSATGKDTLFLTLKKKFANSLRPIVPYTTRPKRTQEIDGVEYHFVSLETLEVFAEKGKIIERRIYDTALGLWHYATVDDGQIDLVRNAYLTIITLEAYKSFKAYFGASQVIPLYIKVEETERIKRATQREANQSAPQYEELKRRVKADLEDFSDLHLEAASITTVFENDSFEACTQALSSEILRYLERTPND